MSSELRNRILYGSLAAVVTVLAIFVLGHFATFAVSLVLGLAGWREYARMMDIRQRPMFHYLGYGLVFTLFTFGYYVKPAELSWIWLTWVLGFFLLYLENFLHQIFQIAPIEADPKRDWTVLCRFILGVLYIYFIFGYVGPIVSKQGSNGGKHFGEQLLFLGLMVIFFGDIGAYFGGHRWGKRKLWPAFSPNKTVEGGLTGVGASILASLLSFAIFKLAFKESLALNQCLLVAIVCPPLAQAADFLESLMKRAAGTKDSGGFLPGHGGILDRVDGLAFVMPLLYFLF